jgi:hypothetical protein
VAVTQADVVGIAPELAAITDPARFTRAIADAQVEFNAAVLGTKYDLVVKYVVAHRLALQERNKGAPGGRGPVQSVTLGPLAKTFGDPAGRFGMGGDVPPEYAGTSYGTQAWAWIRQAAGGPWCT